MAPFLPLPLTHSVGVWQEWQGRGGKMDIQEKSFQLQLSDTLVSDVLVLLMRICFIKYGMRKSSCESAVPKCR